MNPINFQLLAICFSLTVLLLWVEHWFPYPVRQHKLYNYVAGVAAILIGFSVYCLVMGMELAAMLAWAFSMAGGLAVGLAYLVDWVLNALLRQHDERAGKTDD